MKTEIIYRGKQILVNTYAGITTFTAYPSAHSSFTAKEFTTLPGAQKYIDRMIKNKTAAA